MQYRVYKLLALLAVLLLASSWLFAQGESATISGIVTDSSNAVVPGATVTVVSTGTGLTRSATTASGGEYAITNLPPATYTLTIERSGFDKYSRQVTLNVGGRMDVSAQLSVTGTATTVEVTASNETAVVNTENQTLSQ